MTPFAQTPLRILIAALGAALASCGGGGGSGTEAAPDPENPPVLAFAGTAYLKTENTVLYAGKNYGLARGAFQGQVDVCNAYRASVYELPAVTPAEDKLAKLDVTVHEKYFDTDKALTLITGTGLELTDMPRWLADLKANADAGIATYPDVPPDCTVVSESVRKNGTLWRDGITYDLRYSDQKAVGNRGGNTKEDLTSQTEFSALPGDLFLGQSCRVVAAPAGTLSDSKSCIWDVFPYQRYLNFPYALSGLVQFGPSAGLMETIEPQEVDRGKAIATSVFQIPDGFTVTVN
jgi:hypothetical protein